MSLPELETVTDSPYVCRRSDNILSVIEKCLDNGLGSCLIVEDSDRLVGRVCLDDIRRAILDGTAISDPTLDRHLRHLDAGESLRNDTTEDDVLRAIIDHRGQLTDISVDRSMQPLQVSRPDLSSQEFRSILDAFISSWISSKGPYVDKFEREFSGFIGVDHGVAVTNGTVALHLALIALGIGPGDEVIVPDLTFAATINAVLYCGAKPVIVDVDRDTWCMTVKTMAPAVTSRTKAVIPVHLYGRPAEIGPIVEYAHARSIAVVEDCAEAPGARYDGRMVGQFGDVSCFSFYANKIVTTGEGGMCLTNSDALSKSIRRLRDHGMSPDRSYWHERVGYNYRLTNLQAAIGQAQLWRIDGTLERNRQIEALYRETMADIPGIEFAPLMSNVYDPVVWLACVKAPSARRDEIMEKARCANIETRPFFHPLSSLPPYASFGRHCPNSIELAGTGMNLPTSRDVDGRAVARIADVFRSVLGTDGGA